MNTHLACYVTTTQFVATDPTDDRRLIGTLTTTVEYLDPDNEPTSDPREAHPYETATAATAALTAHPLPTGRFPVTNAEGEHGELIRISGPIPYSAALTELYQRAAGVNGLH